MYKLINARSLVSRRTKTIIEIKQKQKIEYNIINNTITLHHENEYRYQNEAREENK